MSWNNPMICWQMCKGHGKSDDDCNKICSEFPTTALRSMEYYENNPSKTGDIIGYIVAAVLVFILIWLIYSRKH